MTLEQYIFFQRNSFKLWFTVIAINISPQVQLIISRQNYKVVKNTTIEYLPMWGRQYMLPTVT